MIVAFSQKVRDFIRCCETLLSEMPGTEPLSSDDLQAVRIYLTQMNERFSGDDSAKETVE